MPARRTARPLYRDPSQSVETRVQDLLDRMTVDEKIRQLCMGAVADLCNKESFSKSKARKFSKGLGIGALLNPRMFPPRKAAAAIRDAQRFIISNSRLGIPAMVICETLHGFMSKGSTIFPQIIGAGSSWDPDLIRRMASAAAFEARACGAHQGLAPDLDLARDARWGRVEETYGEDPYLVAHMGAAYVRGLQGKGPGVDKDHVVATVKHFTAHGTPESGINLGPVSGGQRELYTSFLPPFRAAVVDAGALSVMPAYSSYDGVPCHANAEMLTRILREEWGFPGYVISDFGGVIHLLRLHVTAGTTAEAAVQALSAGMDLEAPNLRCYNENLPELVKTGAVDIALIDRAVRRVLRVKFLAGLFDLPLAEPARAARVLNNPVHRKLCRQVAQESIVLLKNERNLLPLSPAIKTLAVIGPNADEGQLGGYSVHKEEVVTTLAGVRAAVAKGTRVIYAQGCETWRRKRDGFEAAVKAAKSADAAIVVVGDTSRIAGGLGWGDDDSRATCGESFDRAEIDLPGVQEELVRAVVETGTPTIVVLINGRPMSIEWIADHADAIVEAWYPGQEGGHAVADILFGKVNPSGKLTISFPRTVGQIPVFYNHMKVSKGVYHKPGTLDEPGRDYVFHSPEPRWEFGHGLSYTKFKYSGLKLSARRIARAGRVEVSIDVTNAGKRRGKEVVQLYLRDEVSSVCTPVHTLRGFEKIDLAPGKKRTVRFTLGPEDFALYDRQMKKVVEPGMFEVSVGGLKKKFEVTV